MNYDNMQVRKPTKREVYQIARLLMTIDEMSTLFEEDSGSLEYAVKVISDYYVAVIDEYFSDCPSYCGKIFTIYWGEVNYQTVIVEAKNEFGLKVLSNIEFTDEHTPK